MKQKTKKTRNLKQKKKQKQKTSTTTIKEGDNISKTRGNATKRNKNN